MLILAGVFGSGCVIGYLGEVTVSGSEDLEGIRSVLVDLPDTPLPVIASAVGPEGAHLGYRARWHSVGGTRKDAEDNTLEPKLDFQEVDEFARLTAAVPVELEDLLDLEMESIELPADRDLELVTGVGDVEVTGLEGGLFVDVSVGDVRVDCGIGDERCGRGGVAVETGRGRIKVYTRGNADLYSGGGSVELYQQGASQRDVYIYTGSGDVVVELASDANLDLEAWGHTIFVSTDTIDTIAHGYVRREVGNGTHRVAVATGGGDVEITRGD
jgi:hypothetical protein